MKTRMSTKPPLNFGMLVRCIVVNDQMQIQLFRRGPVDRTKELNPFIVTVPMHHLRDHVPLSDIQSSEQCRRPISSIIVCHRPQSARTHWQSGLRTIECLDLALLIATQDDHVFRRVEVKADNVTQFFLKSRVVGYFKGLGFMGFEVVQSPDSADRRSADSGRLLHRPRRPVRLPGRFLLSGQTKYFRGHILANRRFASGPRRVFLQASDTKLKEAISPHSDCPSRAMKLKGGFVIPLARGSCQNNLGALNLASGSCFFLEPIA